MLIELIKKFSLVCLVIFSIISPSIYYASIQSSIGIGHVLLSLLYSLPIAFAILTIPNKIIRLLLYLVVWFVVFCGGIFVAIYHNYINEGEIFGVLMTNQYEAGDLGQLVIHYYSWYIVFMILMGVITSIFIVITDISSKITSTIFALSVILCVLLNFEWSVNEYMPYIVINKYIKAKQQISEIAHKQTSIETNNIPFYAKVCKSQQVYVLAVGESLNYSHFSPNYKRENTPLLNKNIQTCLYSDYYSTALYTHQALPLLLSTAEASSYESVYERPYISPILSKSFKSYFISHRAQLTNNTLHHYLSDMCDSTIYVDNDSCISSALNKIIQNGENAFFILHFLGNHAAYSNCIDACRAYFPDYNKTPDIRSDSLIINAYDNSVRYTDYVLSKCISSLQAKRIISSLLFVSDHGEYVDAKSGGHGFSFHPTKDEYHVPLMVWYSDEYAAAYPDKVANMIKHKDEPVCGDHVFWSVLDMAGIVIDSTLQQEGMSIFGDSLRPHQRTLLLPDGKTIMEL